MRTRGGVCKNPGLGFQVDVSQQPQILAEPLTWGLGSLAGAGGDWGAGKPPGWWVQSWASRAVEEGSGASPPSSSFCLKQPRSSVHACSAAWAGLPQSVPVCLSVRMCIVNVYVACVRSGVSAASPGFSVVHKLRPEDVKALGDS